MQNVFLSGLMCLMLMAPQQARAADRAPFINTWLVAGTFDNAQNNAGFERDWIGEAQVRPREGTAAGDRTWQYFDDRLFSRNLDDYVDLFAYFRVKRAEPIAAKVAYAHVYVHSATAQPAQLRLGADNEIKAWVNGALVAAHTQSAPEKDMVKAEAGLVQGWNRVLLKVGNQENGRFGFYARLTDAEGNRLDGLTFSPNGGEGPLQIATKAMPDAATGDMPVGYRGWAYVAADAQQAIDGDFATADMLRKPEIALQASAFVFTAQGGTPPYRWAWEGDLPEGLTLREDGSIEGTVGEYARPGEYAFAVEVSDGAGATASKPLKMLVKERPNKWYEEARLTALLHHPEAMPEDAFDEFAGLMKRQGYGIGMVISYNNGHHKYRWPSIFEPDCPVGDLVGKYKAALEKAGLKFGMYVGNLNGPNHGGANGSLLLVEDAVRRYQPAAFWFDWAGWNGVSLDAIYSMIKTYNPETVIVLNGVPTMSNGDWDVICFEGWGAWGDRIWDLWPFHFRWPKQHAVESWRLVADPAFEYSKDVVPAWDDYLRLQIALIGEGFIANIDHSVTIRSGVGEDDRLASLEDSIVLQAHRKMAQWANPKGLPPLHESYTQVNPGPLAEATSGYNTINLARDAVYVHMLETPYGKTGKPETPTVAVGPVLAKVKQVTWMNAGESLAFEQKGDELFVDIATVAGDPIDTILKVDLAEPHPRVPRKKSAAIAPTPAGNLATGKPVRLLSNRGEYALPGSACHFAMYGVDGNPDTFACGGNEWDWTYHVDLRETHGLRRIVLHFAPGYPTEYKVHLSEDGAAWKTVAHVTGCKGGTHQHAFEPTRARYVRIHAIKPDGPNQEGSQMHIAELEVYE